MAVDRKISDFTEIGNKILLEETFYVLSKKNTVFRVQLSASGLCLLKESSDIVKKQTINIKDIIGCQCLRSKRRSRSAASCVCQSLPRTPALKVVDENSSEQDETDTSAYLYIYAYILQNSRRGPKKRERTIITLRFRSFDKYEDNNREAQRWRSVIKNLMNGQHISKTPSLTEIPSFHSDERKLLIFLNPKSGPGKGRLLFQQRVVPVLQEAEMQFDLHITKYANYAREFVRTNNLSHWRGIILLGGDGILFETLNGIFERPDWLNILQQIPIGIIPCGSGNGLARTICHCYNEPYTPNPVLAATLAVVRKNSSPMDLVRVETTSQIMYSFLSVGWGLISDIDIESERFRAIGGQRFTVWSVARLLDLRTYKGKLWYLPIGETVPVSVIPQIFTNDCENDLPEEVNLETTDIATESRQRLDSWYSATSRRSAYFSATGSSYQSMIDSSNGDHHGSHKVHMYGPASQLPALTAPIPAHWTCVEGNFVMVHASYQTHLGEDCLFAPNSRLNDGVIWLLILHAGLSRAQLLSFLLALSSGTHMDPSNGDLIEMIAVKAFRLVPEESPSTGGHITVDGELVEYGPIQAEVFPGLANIMVP